MKIPTYMIIMGIVAFNYLPMQLFSFITPNVTLIIILCLIFLGPIICKKNNTHINTFNNRKWVYIVLLLLIISSIYPVVKAGQSFVSTLIALRYTFPIIYLLVLLRVSPNAEDLEVTFSFLGKLALVMGVIAIVFPEWFIPRYKLSNLHYSDTNDLSLIWPGFQCAVLYFYILIGKLWKSSTSYNVFLWALVFLLYIVIVQNRSTLICAIPFFCIAFIKSKIRFKWLIFTIAIIALGGYIISIIGDLIMETKEQLGDMNYNRWQAVQFFLISSEKSFYTFLFGHGIPSVGSSYLNSLLSAQETRLAYISDIGLFGTYFYYGICMLLVIYRFIFFGIFSKRSPIYLRLYSIWMLLVPTIHCFGTLSNCSETIRFVIYFYLIIYYSSVKGQDGCFNNNRQLQFSGSYSKVLK